MTKKLALTSLFDDLADRGYALLENIVEQNREESLHLEFKTLSSQKGNIIAKDDRRLISKAVSGFSNAEGGVLLLGVETTKSDGLDVATALKTFDDVVAFRNRITSIIPELLSPPNNQIEVSAILDPKHRKRGLIAINVPASDSRPHMSIPHHQYFRRGSDGTRVLEHAEVRELMLVAREGKLSINLRMQSGASSGDMKFAFHYIISLRNEGRIPVKAPFIKIIGASVTHREQESNFRRRNLSRGGVGIYTSSDVIIHIDDELDIGMIETGLDIRQNTGSGRKETIEQILESADQQAFSIRPWLESRQATNSYDKLLSATVVFGAENAPAQEVVYNLDKWTTFKMMTEHLLAKG